MTGVQGQKKGCCFGLRQACLRQGGLQGGRPAGGGGGGLAGERGDRPAGLGQLQAFPVQALGRAEEEPRPVMAGAEDPGAALESWLGRPRGACQSAFLQQ